jgi:hypothetical protein
MTCLKQGPVAGLGSCRDSRLRHRLLVPRTAEVRLTSGKPLIAFFGELAGVIVEVAEGFPIQPNLTDLFC